MPEGMEAGPLGAGHCARRREDALGEVIRVEDRVGGRAEHELALATARDERAQPVGDLERDRQVSARVPGFQRADYEAGSASAPHALTHRDVGSVAVERQVPDLEPEQLRTAHASPGP
jgi:hypothetical protein